MARTEEARTYAAVAKALAGNHPPEVERALVSIAARAARDARRNEATGSTGPACTCVTDLDGAVIDESRCAAHRSSEPS